MGTNGGGARRKRTFTIQQHSIWGVDAAWKLDIDYTISLIQQRSKRVVGADGLRRLTGERHKPQWEALKAANAPASVPEDGRLFDPDLKRAYRLYKAQLNPRAGADRENLLNQQPELRELFNGEQTKRIYLFNVIVALEWRPDSEYFRVLEVAFQRASDYLFDVTNGHCAFGQVFIGGAELMGAADIQIVASDRFHPRSWVGGLLLPEKFVPIRIGRAFWDGRRRRSIGWEEPEGYRVLVHEWLHYGFGLKDAYLRTKEVSLNRGRKAKLRMPDRAPVGVSVMADSAISELWPAEVNEGSTVTKEYFPALPLPWEPNRGPYELPLPLPHVCSLFGPERPLGEGPKKVRHATAVKKGSSPQEDGTRGENDNVAASSVPEVGGHGLDQSWLYLYKKGEDDDTISRFIPQGTLGPPPAPPSEKVETHSREGQPENVIDPKAESELTVLGEENGEKLIVICEQREKARGTLSGTKELNEGESEIVLASNEFTALTCIPLISVREASTDFDRQIRTRTMTVKPPSHVPSRSVVVEVHPVSTPHELDAWLLPLGYSDVPEGLREVARIGAGKENVAWTVPTLDGHVLVRFTHMTNTPASDTAESNTPESNTAKSNTHYMVYPFSQGGGPESHDPIGRAPSTGGSADGNLLVYFHNQEPQAHAPELHMIATRIPGEPLGWPDGQGIETAGGIYALTVNRPLENVVTEPPTLVLSFHWPEKDGEPMVGLKPVIYRITKSGGWQSLVGHTHAPAGRDFVAMPLVEQTAPGLYKERPESEFYRIFWLGRAPR